MQSIFCGKWRLGWDGRAAAASRTFPLHHRTRSNHGGRRVLGRRGLCKMIWRTAWPFRLWQNACIDLAFMFCAAIHVFTRPPARGDMAEPAQASHVKVTTCGWGQSGAVDLPVGTCLRVETDKTPVVEGFGCSPPVGEMFSLSHHKSLDFAGQAQPHQLMLPARCL